LPHFEHLAGSVQVAGCISWLMQQPDSSIIISVTMAIIQTKRFMSASPFRIFRIL
jgi:hypothetical protein